MFSSTLTVLDQQKPSFVRSIEHTVGHCVDLPWKTATEDDGSHRVSRRYNNHVLGSRSGDGVKVEVRIFPAPVEVNADRLECLFKSTWLLNHCHDLRETHATVRSDDAIHNLRQGGNGSVKDLYHKKGTHEVCLNTFHVEQVIGFAAEAVEVDEGDQLLVHPVQGSAGGEGAWFDCVVVDVERN